MTTDLSPLESKVDRIVSLVGQLTSENAALRARIAHLQTEKNDLHQRMTEARGRLESLMDKLPAED